MTLARFLAKLRILLINNYKSRRRRTIVLVVLALLCLNYYFIWSSPNDFIEEAHKKNVKVVQLLTERFSYKNWDVGELGYEPFRLCSQPNCYMIKKDTFFQRPIEKSDAVVIHAQNLWFMPSRKSYKRNPQQLWVYFSMEPQRFSFCSPYYDPTDLDDWFNVTATFRSDSTIVTPYKSFGSWSTIFLEPGFVSAFKSKYGNTPSPELALQTDIRNKPKKKSPILWFVSHCDTPSRREDYVQELLKYIDIDIYGSCGGNFGEHGKKSPCDDLKPEDRNECNHKHFNEYKFYLAFENSMCEEYITEKYWKLYHGDLIFNANLIPIVRGARVTHYLKVAPPNSFVSAESYATPRELADYLHYLTQNVTAYLEFFQWKAALLSQFQHNKNQQLIQKGPYMRTELEVFCEVCKLLHNQTYMNTSPSQRKIWHMSSWFGP